MAGINELELSGCKTALRAMMREKRMGQTPEERARISKIAAGHILAHARWKSAGSVALYAALPGEADTFDLLEAAWGEGKTVFLPRCSRQNKGEMRFFPCPDRQSLTPGPYGILEPAEQPHKKIAPDIIIIPGLAFDARGNRLGMGKGYYDRLLGGPDFAACLRVGFAFSFQILDNLPREDWDCQMHAVCTERGLIWISQA